MAAGALITQVPGIPEEMVDGMIGIETMVPRN